MRGLGLFDPGTWCVGARIACAALALAALGDGASLARAEGPRGPHADAARGRIGMRDVMTPEAREAPYPGPIGALAWSPDGSRIASAAFGEGDHPGSSDVMLWDAATGRRVATVPRAAPLPFSLAFTPDSRLLVMAAARAPGAPMPREPKPDHGRRLAVAGAVVNEPRAAPTLTTVVEVRDARDGAPVWAARLDPAPSFQSLAWGGASGGTVALGLPGTGARGEVGDRVVALDARTGARRWTARWPSASVDGLAFSPDGRLLDAATGETLLAVDGLREPRAVAWGPAGPRLLLAFNDGPRTRVIELTR